MRAAPKTAYMPRGRRPQLGKKRRQEKAALGRAAFTASPRRGGMQRKTDDSYANRPFFHFKQDVRETACFGASSFPQCRLFLFFKQRNRTPEAYL